MSLIALRRHSSSHGREIAALKAQSRHCEGASGHFSRTTLAICASDGNGAANRRGDDALVQGEGFVVIKSRAAHESDYKAALRIATFLT